MQTKFVVHFMIKQGCHGVKCEWVAFAALDHCKRELNFDNPNVFFCCFSLRCFFFCGLLVNTAYMLAQFTGADETR